MQIPAFTWYQIRSVPWRPKIEIDQRWQPRWTGSTPRTGASHAVLRLIGGLGRAACWWRTRRQWQGSCQMSGPPLGHARRCSFIERIENADHPISAIALSIITRCLNIWIPRCINLNSIYVLWASSYGGHERTIELSPNARSFSRLNRKYFTSSFNFLFSIHFSNAS